MPLSSITSAPLHFSHVAIVGKHHAPVPLSASALAQSRQVLQQIAQFVQSLGCQVSIEEDTAIHLQMDDWPRLDVTAIGAQCDVGLVVGGDGTMLGIGRELSPFGVPLIGINQGRLGFITDVPLSSYEQVLPPMLQGEFDEDRRSLLDGRVLRDGGCIFESMAMNDVVVNRGNSSGMVELQVDVDGHFVARQRADGLILATSTGSTAYSLSAGGPILHPAVPGFVMVPIAPHTLSNRPLLLPDTAKIAIKIAAGKDASVSFDMHSVSALQHGDRIEVARSVHQVRFLHPKGWSYFDTLREKLHWNEGGV